MSRIHEALKKAAQERSSQVATGTVPDLADVRSLLLGLRPIPGVARQFSASGSLLFDV